MNNEQHEIEKNNGAPNIFERRNCIIITKKK